jgi:hypothetical protein
MSEKESFCRCCLNKVGDFSSMKAVNITALNGLLSINGYDGFFDCTGFIKIPLLDVNPKICYSCELNLETTIIFLQQCTYSNRILYEAFLNKQMYHPTYTQVLPVHQKQCTSKHSIDDDRDSSSDSDSIDVGILSVKEAPMIQKSPVIIQSEATTIPPNDDSNATETASENESTAAKLKTPKFIKPKNFKAKIACPILFCKKIFRTNNYLKRHLKTKHTTNRKLIVQSVQSLHSCDQCGKKVKGMTALKTHKKNHCNNINFECAMCSEFIQIFDDFKLHIQDEHEIDFLTYLPKYKCELCELRFHNSYHFCQHLKKHNQGNCIRYIRVALILLLIFSGTVQSWKMGQRIEKSCASCNKVFTVLYSFKKHIKNCQSGNYVSLYCRIISPLTYF